MKSLTMKWYKIKTPLKEKPSIVTKVDGVEVHSKSITGQFKSIELQESEFNGAKSVQVVIGLETEEGDAKLSMNITNPVETFLNSLAGAGMLGKLLIEVYEEGGYARIKVTNDGQKCPWAYPIDTFKELKSSIKINGNTLTDRTNLIPWLKSTLIPQIQSQQEAKF